MLLNTSKRSQNAAKTLLQKDVTVPVFFIQHFLVKKKNASV